LVPFVIYFGLYGWTGRSCGLGIFWKKRTRGKRGIRNLHSTLDCAMRKKKKSASGKPPSGWAGKSFTPSGRGKFYNRGNLGASKKKEGLAKWGKSVDFGKRFVMRLNSTKRGRKGCFRKVVLWGCYLAGWKRKLSDRNLRGRWQGRENGWRLGLRGEEN